MSRAEKEENPLPNAGVRGNSWLEDDGEEEEGCEQREHGSYGAPHNIVSPTMPRFFMHDKPRTAPRELTERDEGARQGVFDAPHADYRGMGSHGVGDVVGAGGRAAEGGRVERGLRGATSARRMFDQRGVVAMTREEHFDEHHRVPRRFEIENSTTPNRRRAEDSRPQEQHLVAAHMVIEYPGQDQRASSTSPPPPSHGPAGGDHTQQQPFLRPPIGQGPGSQRRMLEKSPR